MTFRRSTFCKTDEGMCVEVDTSTGSGVVLMRNSTDRECVLQFNNSMWLEFVVGVKTDKFS